MSPGMSDRANKNTVLSLSLSPESWLLQMDLVQNLDRLKVGLGNDLEQDQRFEGMLQAVLN